MKKQINPKTLVSIMENIKISTNKDSTLYQHVEKAIEHMGNNSGQLFFTTNAIKLINELEIKINKVI